MWAASSSSASVVTFQHIGSLGPYVRSGFNVPTVSEAPPSHPQLLSGKYSAWLACAEMMYWWEMKLSSMCDVNMLSASTYWPAMSKYVVVSEAGT